MKLDRRNISSPRARGSYQNLLFSISARSARLSKHLVTTTKSFSPYPSAVPSMGSASVLSNVHYQFRWVTCDAATILSARLRNLLGNATDIEVVIEITRATIEESVMTNHEELPSQYQVANRSAQHASFKSFTVARKVRLRARQRAVLISQVSAAMALLSCKGFARLKDERRFWMVNSPLDLQPDLLRGPAPALQRQRVENLSRRGTWW